MIWEGDGTTWEGGGRREGTTYSMERIEKRRDVCTIKLKRNDRDPGDV